MMDPSSQMIYLFGGWDGNRDLSDFWAYNVALGKWTLISADTEADGGPPSRSCHKMVVDPVYRQIFVLGRYLERGLRDLHTNIKSDFYVYDIGSNTWTQITDDTAALGGPSLIFDHQMCLDSDTRCISGTWRRPSCKGRRSSDSCTSSSHLKESHASSLSRYSRWKLKSTAPSAAAPTGVGVV